MEDKELLRRYVQDGSQEAFTELVKGYLDFVYSTARRQLHDGELAKDVSQTVFCLLARKSGSLMGMTTIAGWLYRATCFTAAKTLRGELRRRRREQQAIAMNSGESKAHDPWEALAPMLDEAMATLGDQDRLAVLLRFFQRRPMRAVGDALGVSEAAAKMRVARSLERLRGFFAQRGVACSIAGLAAVLTGRAVEAAPTYLAGPLSSAALAGASGGSLIQITAFLARFKAATLILGGSSAVLALLIGWHASNPAQVSTSGAVPGRRLSHTTQTVFANRFERAIQIAAVSPDGPDLAEAIANLRAALRSTNNSAVGFEVAEAIRRFGPRQQAAFGVLKEEAGTHDQARHSTDEAEVVPRRAVGGMGNLGKSVPEAAAWLWAQYDSEPSSASDSIAFIALCALEQIGFEPPDIPRLAESVLARTDDSRIGGSAANANETSDDVEVKDQTEDAFSKSQVAGWIADLVKREPEAAKPYLSALRSLLDASEPGARFWAACALLPGDGAQNPKVIAELADGLKNADQDRLAWASKLLQDFGAAARPLALWMLEAAKASAGNAQEWAFLATGKIAGELRNQVPEVDQALTREEADQSLLDKVNAGTYTGNDLVAMLKDSGSAAMAAGLLGDMGPAATNALPAMFEAEAASRQDHPEYTGDILNAIHRIDPHAALTPEDALSVITNLVGTSPHTLGDSDAAARFVHDARLDEMSWCTRAGFSRFVTNVAPRNLDGYSAFVGAVLAKEPAWTDLLPVKSEP